MGTRVLSGLCHEARHTGEVLPSSPLLAPMSGLSPNSTVCLLTPWIAVPTPLRDAPKAPGNEITKLRNKNTNLSVARLTEEAAANVLTSNSRFANAQTAHAHEATVLRAEVRRYTEANQRLEELRAKDKQDKKDQNTR